MEGANQLQKDRGQFMTPKAINEVILKLIILFYLQTELTPPPQGLVDINKASQKVYNSALQHKEYHIIEDLWRNSMNSYLTVRKLLGHLNTCKLLNGWHPLMEKNKMMLLTAEWRKNNPSTPKQVPKTAPVARSSNYNMKKQPQAQKRANARHQPQTLTARATES
ncbi:hypothetical protein O181_058699 [Austropuccinia psidii MF-1]|uniref:Uncharacterized protein n=1 Tax=Austropuccinia psidii MF-1 TaxID=1389203 RepID=A0A9Q3ECV6_9BASI|nr:hypothetical protein [Austropuccinia psidii MF-1]